MFFNLFTYIFPDNYLQKSQKKVLVTNKSNKKYNIYKKVKHFEGMS